MWPRLIRIVCQVVCAMPGSRRQEARSAVLPHGPAYPFARLIRPPWFAPRVLHATCYVVCCKSSLQPQLMRHVPIFAEALQSITERTPHSVGCIHVARCALRAAWHVITPALPCPARSQR